jgi:hypothetical protein
MAMTEAFDIFDAILAECHHVLKYRKVLWKIGVIMPNDSCTA